MGLMQYFETTKGIAILATSDADGNVNLALYAAPHMTDDQTLVLVMAHNLSYANLQSNPKAAYMFIEAADPYQGKRLYLRRIRQVHDPDLVQSVRRRKRFDEHGQPPSESSAVYFTIENVRPLTGN